MSVAFFLWPLLFFLIPVSTLAGPPSTASSSLDPLSPDIASLVPSCAHTCLQTFLADFPSSVCRNRQCLCTQDSRTGLTLGEGALRCLASECSKTFTTRSKVASVYEICNGVQNAKPMTHPTLTATHVVVQTRPSSNLHSNTEVQTSMGSRTKFPPSFNNPTSQSHSKTTSSPLPTSIIVDTSTTPVSSTFSSSFASRTSPITSPTTLPLSPNSSPTNTAAAAGAAKPILTKPQIAGVTVASVAAAGLTIGVLFFIFCFRKRKPNRRDSGSSFGGDKIIGDHARSPPPSSSGTAQNLEHGLLHIDAINAGQLHVTPPRDRSTRRSFWRGTTQSEEIGVAVAPDVRQETPLDHSPVTPMSATSYRTTSQLLPDKPRYSLFPQPLQPHSHLSPVSPVDQQRLDVPFEQRGTLPLLRPGPSGRGVVDTSQPNLQGGRPSLRAVPSDPFLDSSLDARPPQQFRPYRVPPTQEQQDISPGQATANRNQSDRSVEVLRKPVPARRPLEIQRSNPASALPIPVVNPRPPQTQPAVPVVDLLSLQPPRRKSKGKQRQTGRRPPTHYSSGSDTSFEDEENEEVPLVHSTLSPVVESPPIRSRTTGVRYPVIPKSASESPFMDRTVRQVPRQQLELNPATDKSKGKRKAGPSIYSAAEKTLPDVPELAGSELQERWQQPHNSNRGMSPRSAKYKILVAPGLEEGIENVSTPRSKGSGEWTPMSTPTKRTR